MISQSFLSRQRRRYVRSRFRIAHFLSLSLSLVYTMKFLKIFENFEIWVGQILTNRNLEFARGLCIGLG